MSGGKVLVLETLKNATSQQPELLKPAEQDLQSWETQPGFYFTLVEIFSEHSIDVSIRWLAVIYFKNGVDKYWRKTAPNAISEEEKAQIRPRLLTNLQEPALQIAKQLAVLISKIARIEFPEQWPALLPTVFEALKSDSDLVKHRTLLTLHHIIKHLASKRLPLDKRIFQDLANEMYGYILEFWNCQTEAFLCASDHNTMCACIERSQFALKILRKLTIYGFKKPHESNHVVLFMDSIFKRIKVMLELRKQNESDNQLCIVSEKYIILFTKVLLEYLENYPFSFLQFIKPSLEMATVLVFTSAGDGLLFEKFIVQCINLMKGVITCHEYKPCRVIEDTKNSETLEAYQIKNDFFSESVLSAICHKLIIHYFLLTPEDVSLWDSDPEEFSVEADSGGESWKYNLRSCVENFFVSLFHQFDKYVSPIVLEMIRASQALVDPSDIQGLLQKDAVYNAAGLASFELFKDVEFDQWFQTSLINELKIKDSNYRIIRRRTIWLIGQWTNVKFSQENRPILYEACLHLLSPEEDFAVRVAAAQTLKMSVDNFEFDSDAFMPYLPNIFVLLFSLLKEAKECDTKMQVLHVMSFIIEVIGSGIQPYAGPLIHYLPELWEESADHNLLRCAILTTLIHIVMGLLILSLATNTEEQCHIYLLEDALQLWNVVIENARKPSSALLDLFNNLFPILETSSENLKICLQIIIAYTLLCPHEFLTRYGSTLVTSFQSLLVDLKTEGIVLIMRCVEMMVLVLPNDAPNLIATVLPNILNSVSDGDHYSMVLSMYLSVLARVLLYKEDTFTWAVNETAVKRQQRPEEVLDMLVVTWTTKLPIVSPEERQKLCALGLAQLCGSGWPPVVKHIQSAMTSIAWVVFDMSVEDTNEDKLVMAQSNNLGSPEPYDIETEHAKRRIALAKVDPVHTISLRIFFAQHLRHFHKISEEGTIEAIVHNLDMDCKNLIQELLVSS